MPVSTHRRSITTLLLVFLLASITLSSCGQVATQGTGDQDSQLGVATKTVEVIFTVELPEPIVSNDVYYLEILDEVTGLALNSSRHALNAVDDTHYSAKLNFPINSIVKYRYIREGQTMGIEYTSQKRQVRYRIYYAASPGEVQDQISCWNDTLFTQPVGRIMGQVVFEKNNQPVPGSLIAVGGQQTYTSSDGSFFIDQVPIGTHNLVVYSPDGSHLAFQQGATIAADSTTPAVIRVSPSHFVEATFIVHPPVNSPTGIPIRLVGNSIALGNTFGDLRGGMNTIANRAPLLRYTEDGTYTIQLQLPVGFDLQYKYSLGDGFWNAELYADGRPKLRQFIVPDNDFTVSDQIDTWSTPGLSPITFTVNAASNTPVTDQISIQFNPYGWTEAIPMWSLGEGRWAYILYNPLNIIGETGYRFCRNDQCGVADNAETPGIDGRAPTFKPNSEAQLIEITISRWIWNGENTEPITVPSYPISPKPEGFVTGIEFTADYSPSWQPYLAQSFLGLKRINSDWVIISPTWHWLSSNPPALAPVLGLDPSWHDLIQSIRLAQAAGLKVAVRPTTSFYEPASVWWSNATRDDGWWQTWFDRYRLFLLNSADAAQQTGADAVILGDEYLSPALPGGLINDQAARVPADADQRWTTLISDIRGRYNGQVIWRAADLSSAQTPTIIHLLDGIYVILDQKLSDADPANPEELEQAWMNFFENDLRLVRDKFDKPVWIGLAYPSVSRAATGCLSSGDHCIPASVFAQAGLDVPGATLNLVEQAEIYNAAFRAINQIDWISGILSVGYYPPVALQDKSLSIHGKPAEDVTWFWFEKFRTTP